MESSNNNNNRPPSCGTWVPSSTAPLGKVLSSALSSAWLQDKELVPVTFQTSQLGILEMPHCAQRAETFLPVSLHLGGSGQQEGTCSPSRQGRGSATLPPSRQRTKRGLPGPGREAAGGRGGGCPLRSGSITRADPHVKPIPADQGLGCKGQGSSVHLRSPPKSQ